VPFTAVNADQLLVLESSSPAIGADGFSTATITARVTVDGNRQRPVTFSTSLGSLVRSVSGQGAKSDTVTADAQGVATIFLRSENTVGTAVVTAEVLGFTRQILVVFQPVAPGDIISLRADPSTVPADGPTGNGTRLTATIAASIPQQQRLVKFTTTNGSFVGGDSDTPDSGNVAQVTLKSASPGTAVVTATVAGVTARTTVEFVRALPDTIFVASDAGSVNRAGADSTRITVTLSRAVGQVSNGTPVTFTAVDSAGTTIGRFSEITLANEDQNDTSTPKRLVGTAVFNPDDTAALGTATITATVGSVKGTLTIQIQ
jgi:hypothetical protein